jgi:hypothetical protein
MSRTFLTSDETREVINGHAKEMAEAYGCNRSYYDQIVSDHETDGFEKFIRSLYIPALICGRPVTAWVTRLKLLEEKYRPISKELHIGHQTARFAKESADVTCAHINDRPLNEQLKEVTEAITELEVLKASLIKAINDLHETPMYNGRPYKVAK